jgi:hypothetical protein
MKKMLIEFVNREVLEATARIIGPQGGAAQALAEFDRRKAAGEDVVVFRSGMSFIVGPDPTKNCST